MDEQEILQQISFNVIQGRFRSEDEGIDEGLEGQPGVADLIQKGIRKGISPKKIVVNTLAEAMSTVGQKFERGEYLIPDMLASAECVGGAMDILKPFLAKNGVKSKGKLLVATVAGDLHDIGKNIVRIILKGEGYEVIDLGTDVPSDQIVHAARQHQIQFLGLSALLTTTMQSMEKIIRKLKEAGIRNNIKVLIGGAPTSHEFAERIGADVYCRDAFQAVEYLKQARVV